MEQYRRFVRVVAVVAGLALAALLVSALAFSDVKPLQDNGWMTQPADNHRGGKPNSPYFGVEIPINWADGLTRSECTRAGQASCALQGAVAINTRYVELRYNGMIETTCSVPCSGGKPAFKVKIIEGDPAPPDETEPPCNCDDGPCPDGCPS